MFLQPGLVRPWTLPSDKVSNLCCLPGMQVTDVTTCPGAIHATRMLLL